MKITTLLFVTQRKKIKTLDNLEEFWMLNHINLLIPKACRIFS
jgi:hypothetical protein